MKRKVLILGCAGYLGYALACSLVKEGHKILGIDNFVKKKMLEESKSHSIVDIDLESLKKNDNFCMLDMDIREQKSLRAILSLFQPDTIFNFAQIPSAPYSMKSFYTATNTQENNITGGLSLIHAVAEECPDAHIISLGTMGEYPSNCNVEIPEGFFRFDYKGRKSIKLPFPRMGGSWYHQSKISMSNNYLFGSKVYGLRISDIMQGIIYGVNIDEENTTSFYVDECFGTVLNRFISQLIIGMPLTIYGEGKQIRAFLSLRDAIQCYKLIMANPPDKGVYEVYNQFDEAYSVGEIANIVLDVGEECGLKGSVKIYENPRVEPKQDNYLPVNEKLKKLGYKRTKYIDKEIKEMIKTLLPKKEKIEEIKGLLSPKTQWRIKECK